jgi:hypothetical protein
MVERNFSVDRDREGRSVSLGTGSIIGVLFVVLRFSVFFPFFSLAFFTRRPGRTKWDQKHDIVFKMIIQLIIIPNSIEETKNN